MKSDKWLKLGYIWEVESMRALAGLNYTEGGGGNQGRLRYFCSLELILGGGGIRSFVLDIVGLRY